MFGGIFYQCILNPGIPDLELILTEFKQNSEHGEWGCLIDGWVYALIRAAVVREIRTWRDGCTPYSGLLHGKSGHGDMDVRPNLGSCARNQVMERWLYALIRAVVREIRTWID